jgi:hypothetical protein
MAKSVNKKKRVNKVRLEKRTYTEGESLYL